RVSCPPSRLATRTPPRSCCRWSTTNCPAWLPSASLAKGPGHTLQPTALVHEAYLKLVGPCPRPPVSGVPAFSRAGGRRQVMVGSANRLEGPSPKNGTFGGAARPHFVTSGLGETFMSDEGGPDPERLLRLARAEDGAALGQLLEVYRGYLALLARLQIGRRLQ